MNRPFAAHSRRSAHEAPSLPPAAVRTVSYIPEVIDRTRFRRETDAYLVHLARVGRVGQGIAPLLDLRKGELCGSVEFELEVQG